jgi:predicted ATPase
VDLAAQPWHDRLVSRLNDERLAAMEGWARASLLSGADPRIVAADLARVRADEPLREELTELLMWALTVSGRQAEALEAFSETRLLLRDGLGADPGPALAAMHARVLNADASLHPRSVMEAKPPSTNAADRRHQVSPAPSDSLVGRDATIAAVKRLLAERRLLTLTGPGGSGKTRLAVEILARHRAGGGEGWLAELAPLRSGHLAPAVIAAAVGLQVAADSDAEDALAVRLADADALLILDNTEHLDGIGTVVARLLRATRRLRILITSREPLRLADEQRFTVPLLELPASPDEVASNPTTLARNESVRLLVDRTRHHDPGFAVTVTNSTALARIARHLDGLPLALEIAAAWLRLMGPEALAEHLGSARLDLSTRRADAPQRHSSLRHSVAWSFDLLTSAQQRVLCSLSVFAGTFTLPAAEAVCADGAAPVTELVFDLVDRNLVQVVTTAADGPRLRQLQAVRDFAARRAEDLPGEVVEELRARHATWYGAWASQLAANSEGPASPAWLARAVSEADNLRLAIDHHAQLGDGTNQLQLVVDAMVLWFEAGLEGEGRERLAAALEAAPPHAPARPIALTYWAWLRAAGHRGQAAAAAHTALELARERGDPLVEAFALQTLGDTLDDKTEAEAASRAVFDAAARSEGRPVRYGPTAPDAVRCGASATLAALAAWRSVSTALEWQEEALRRAELEGDPRIIAVNSARLAATRLLTGDIDTARTLVARSRPQVSSIVVSRWEDIVGFTEATLMRYEGDISSSEELLARLWQSTTAGGRLLHAVLSAAALAELYSATGRGDEADRVLDVAERVVGHPADAAHLVRLRTRRARVRRLRGDPDGAEAQLAAASAALPRDGIPPERVVWLLESGHLAVVRGDGDRARARLTELDTAVRSAGLRLPPWEEEQRSALASRVLSVHAE